MERIYERDPYAKPSGRQQHSRGRQPKPRSEWMDVLLFYVLPFIAVNGLLFLLVAARPHISIQLIDTKDYKTAKASITVTSILPIKEFSSTQEGSPLDLLKEKSNHYTADISKNGVIEIYAKSINGMTTVQHEHVNILDDVAPAVNDQYFIKDGILTLTLEDSQSGLDYQSVCATNSEGVSFPPASINRQTGTFTFEIGTGGLVIHASDLAGNAMQATFNTHTEDSGSGYEPNNIPSESHAPAPSSSLPEQDTQAGIYIDTTTP